MAYKKNKINLKIIVFLALLSILFFYKIIINYNHGFYPSFDLYYSSFIEKAIFVSNITIYKSFPLWNPYVFSGSPFVGNPPSAMFYPLNVLFLLFPIVQVFNYMFLLNSFLAGVFTYLFARVIKMNKFASLISAITFMFSGPIVTAAFEGHPINSNTFIWLPLALLFLELTLSKRKFIFSLLTGFIISIMFFAGAPQIASYELMFLFAYTILWLLTQTRDLKRIFKSLILFLFSLTIGILISSIQLLPSIEFSQFSQRGGGISYKFATEFSLHPYQTLSFLLPEFFGSPANGTWWGKGTFAPSGYLGTLPFIFAIIAIFFKKNRYIFIFSIISLFSLFYSFGKYSLIFPFFYHYIPLFNNFREPTRFLFAYAFCFSILAGIGSEFIFGNKKKYFTKSLSLIIPILIIITGIILFLKPNGINTSIYEKYVLRNSFAVGINHNILYKQTRNNILLFAVTTTLFCAFLFLKKKTKINFNQLKILTILLIFLDIWYFGYKIISTKSLKEIYNPNLLINKILEDKTTHRVFDMDGTFIPLLGKNKIENITGVDPLYLKDYRDFLWTVGKHMDTTYDSFFSFNSLSNPVILNILNAKYVITNAPINVSGLSLLLKSNSYVGSSVIPNKMFYLYKNNDVLPRAYLVPNAITVNDKKETLNALITDFDPKKYVILEKLPIGVKNNSSLNFSSIAVTKRNVNELSLKVDLKDSGFLVLSEIYFPGWNAYDNGKKIEILKANYILRAMFLDKGQHNIALIYNPNSYQIGLTVSAITLFISFSYIIIYLKKSRKLIK